MMIAGGVVVAVVVVGRKSSPSIPMVQERKHTDTKAKCTQEATSVTTHREGKRKRHVAQGEQEYQEISSKYHSMVFHCTQERARERESKSKREREQALD
jgi:hypothetical protein